MASGALFFAGGSSETLELYEVSRLDGSKIDARTVLAALGRPEASQVPFWRPPGDVLESSWGACEASSGLLAASWGALGGSFGSLDLSWGRSSASGVALEASWALLARMWAAPGLRNCRKRCTKSLAKRSFETAAGRDHSSALARWQVWGRQPHRRSGHRADRLSRGP